MARPAVATRETVFAEADRLLALTIEPTLALVRKTTGGSFSSVQALLTAWKAERDQTAAQPVEMPTEVETRGTALLRTFWQAAVTAADIRVTEAQAAATQEIATSQAATIEVSEALREQEALNEEQAAQIDAQRHEVEQLRMERDQAHSTEHVATARTKELEERLAESQQRVQQAEIDRQTALDEARVALLDKARQEGELLVLRQQVDALLGRLTPPPAV